VSTSNPASKPKGMPVMGKSDHGGKSDHSKLSSLAGSESGTAETANKVPKFTSQPAAPEGGSPVAQARQSPTPPGGTIGRSAADDRAGAHPEAAEARPDTTAGNVANETAEAGQAPPVGQPGPENQEIFAPDQIASHKALQYYTGNAARPSYGLLAIVFALLSAGLFGFLLMEQLGLLPGHGRWVTAGAERGAIQRISTVSMFDAFAVSHLSPHGDEVRQVALTDAIGRAYRAINGGGAQRDIKEGAFWLRQYLARRLGDKKTLWALTQLGSTYARPADAPPDYVIARHLWEIAAALGDPVASCFLGGLHETGLGVPVNKSEALAWYKRAQRLGGCRKLDEAIARVMPKLTQ